MRMAKVHVFSVKVGTSHGLWQYKQSGTHERVVLHGLQPLLDAACRLLGYDRRDRSAIYHFSFSPEPFEGWQVRMEKTREGSDGSCSYRVARSHIGSFAARGRFPGIVRTGYLGAWPENIYLALERSVVGGIVS